MDHSSILPPLKPGSAMTGERAALAVALTVNTLQIGGILLGANANQQGGLFALAALAGLLTILWAIDRWPKTRKQTLRIFVLGLLLSVGVWIVASGTVGKLAKGIIRPPVPQQIVYHLLVKIYAVNHGDFDIDAPQKEIRFAVRDMAGNSTFYFTRNNGTMQVKMFNYGPLTISACGVAQVQSLTAENTPDSKALVGKIGIDKAKLDSCRQEQSLT